MVRKMGVMPQMEPLWNCAGYQRLNERLNRRGSSLLAKHGRKGLVDEFGGKGIDKAIALL